MLSEKNKQELQEWYGANIQEVIPFIKTNSDGEDEEYFEVQMANNEESFYIIVDCFGAVCGGKGTRYYD